MSSLKHLYVQLKQYKESHKPLYFLSAMVFFWTIFDCILSYAVPLILTEHGFSATQMGFILGSSSIAGAAFDFLMCRFVKTVNFRRVFMFMFAISAIFPLILWQAKTIPIYILAMLVWGIYYDLYNFGLFDFVSCYTEKKEHAASFGIVQVFAYLAEIIAPLVASLLIVEYVDFKTFAGSAIFLFVGFLFLILLMIITRKKKLVDVKCEDGYCAVKELPNSASQFKLWKKIGGYVFPALFLTFFLYTVDAFFWTIGPIYSEGLGLDGFNGLLLAAYALPFILVGFFVSKLTSRCGKLKVAYISFLIGAILLSCFALISAINPVLTIGLTFFVSMTIAISYPSLNGSYADYISEFPAIEKDVEGLEDFFTNIGYVIGPILSGFLADTLGIEKAFSAIGVVGVIFALAFIKSALRKKKLNEK
ncbi:MAG: hypothetical protein US89_C0006G0024 [Candidatus Peregrinibacteria bacterium GW2011_GWF2_38_29]|nr:MAG: hypothetical protein US89_C0006G0024 [Candidatus Peregrinibacteria bacterium GW2011_GWF2_38_29]HBB03214.1 hypothetical protein [Candidatus Peregrinibacteria bacterium]